MSSSSGNFLDKPVNSDTNSGQNSDQNVVSGSATHSVASPGPALAGSHGVHSGKRTQEKNSLEPEPEITVKQEDDDDEDIVFIGSRPCLQETPFPLPIDSQKPAKKRKRSASSGPKERRKKPAAGEPAKPHGRPKKYLWDERESESDFVLSDLEESEWILSRSELPAGTSRRKTSRWVCYSEVEEKMFLHWLVQGRSLNYVVNAFKGLRSRNGLYQKMASIRRQFDDTRINIDKTRHFDMTHEGISAPGPIPREDLQKFKVVLFEMQNKPSLKQRISGDTKEQEEVSKELEL